MNNDIVCGICKEQIKEGAIKCKHCGANIIYGATEKERRGSFSLGFMMGFFVGMFVLVLTPQWLNYEFSLNIPVAYGLGAPGLLLVPVGIGVLIGFLLMIRLEDSKRNLIRCVSN